MKTGVIIAVIVLILGGGAFALTRNKKPAAPTSSQTPASTDTTSTANSTTTNTENIGENTISYTSSGFSPASLTVKAGTTITIKNDSSRLLQFDSNPHPDHTDDPELNVGTISPGKSKTVTVTTTGTHGYHNHLNSSDTGTIVVQ